MSVYVDDMKAPFGRMIMCHMYADTSAELDAMADTIGVARKWIQHPNTWREHYDIALVKRALAVKAGAVETTWRHYGEFKEHLATRRFKICGDDVLKSSVAEHMQGHFAEPEHERTPPHHGARMSDELRALLSAPTATWTYIGRDEQSISDTQTGRILGGVHTIAELTHAWANGNNIGAYRSVAHAKDAVVKTLGDVEVKQ